MSSQQDLLSVTAFFSGLVHAVIILGISFKLPDIADLQNTDNMLDVILVNSPNNKEPDDAELISTSNTQGGGQDDRAASSPVPYKAVTNSPVKTIKRTANQQAVTRLSPNQLLTAQQGELSVPAQRPDQTRLESKRAIQGPDRVTTKSQREMERERLIAKLSQQWEDYQKRPNKEYLSPSSKQHEAAEYLDKWRKKVELVGNKNYPRQAQSRGLSGTLILTVEINRNGTINAINVNSPSRHRVLNDAAVRFVRNASPFDPFPKEINRNTDILVITRAFHFLNNNSLSSSDASAAR
ncbi:MAG: energy transducer TonB [Gammaproteobacteria bacterium]|nr:energy transducer TonB [Gammaproteobacteria bacterium]